MKHVIAILTTTLTLCTTAFANGNPKDEQALHAIVQTMEDGWNARSGQQFASVFAEGHDYIVWTGMYMPGTSVETNARAHQGIFDYQYKTTDMELKVDKIRFVRDDLALLHVLGAGYDQGTVVPEHPAVLITILAEKQGGTWKIISFHNCDIELSFVPGEEKRSPVPLSVMYQSWYQTDKSGK